MNVISIYIMSYLFIMGMISLFIYLFAQSLREKGIRLSKMLWIMLAGLLFLAFVF